MGRKALLNEYDKKTITSLVHSGARAYQIAQKIEKRYGLVQSFIWKSKLSQGKFGKLLERQRSDLVKKYAEGSSLKNLANEYNISKRAALNLLLYRNCNVRKYDGDFRKYKTNHNYFSQIDNEHKAYWLGFIVADGCILDRKNRTKCLAIGLSYTDFWHLHKFLADLESNYPIRVYKDNGLKYCDVRMTSDKLTNDLAKYGVVPRKSLISYYPAIPSEMDRHFIRGLFDGDGCLSVSKNGKQKSFSIIGTTELVQSVKNIILNNLDITNTKLSKVKEVRSGDMSRYKKAGPEINKILDWLYDGATIYLDRKHEKYESIKKLYSHV